MNEDTGKEPLNTLLSSEEAELFALVQKYHGIRTRSDVVRKLITQEARRITTEQAPPAAANHQAPCA